jgi:Protein of unknown function (DUF3105)
MSKKGRAQTLDRKARLEQLKTQQTTQARRRFLIIAAVVVPLVLVAGTLGVVAVRSHTSATTAPGIAGLVTYAGLARNHVTGSVAYPQTPPAGGNHSALWQNCGVYSAPVANENAVHSLEHGAMWITYQPNLPADQLALIKSAVAGQPYALVSPYPGLPSQVVATVWGQQLKLPTATDTRLKTFIDTFQSGLRAPEPGGECTGGLGTPTG